MQKFSKLKLQYIGKKAYLSWKTIESKIFPFEMKGSYFFNLKPVHYSVFFTI